MINKAISELYTNELFISVCRKYGKGDFEDLKGIVIEQMLDMGKDKIVHIIENNYLLPYCIRIARNEVVNKYSRFNKLIIIEREENMSESNQAIEDCRNLWSLTHELDAVINAEELNTKHERIIAQIKIDSADQGNRYFFHALVATKMMDKEKYKNAKQLSKATGIPYMTIRSSLKEYYKHLKSQND